MGPREIRIFNRPSRKGSEREKPDSARRSLHNRDSKRIRTSRFEKRFSWKKSSENFESNRNVANGRVVETRKRRTDVKKKKNTSARDTKKVRLVGIVQMPLSRWLHDGYGVYTYNSLMSIFSGGVTQRREVHSFNIARTWLVRNICERRPTGCRTNDDDDEWRVHEGLSKTEKRTGALVSASRINRV